MRCIKTRETTNFSERNIDSAKLFGVSTHV